jgi:GntR family transcriptional regulator, transcriptional repressor for pyruvate dehydrogenase complex
MTALSAPRRPPVTLERVSRVSVVDTVTERLASLISEGHIRPGERLPSEQELMAQLQVGRSSIREAIRGLALIGVVETRQKRGTIVLSPVAGAPQHPARPLAHWALKDLFAVRAALEGLAAQSAAEAATPVELAAIARHAASIEQRIAQGRSYFSENRALHLAIAEASHNAVLVNCLAIVIGGLRDVRESLHLMQEGTPSRDIAEHRQIVAALHARAPARARRLMEAHLLRAVQHLQRPATAGAKTEGGRRGRVKA